jgi:hypothetical protein
MRHCEPHCCVTGGSPVPSVRRALIVAVILLCGGCKPAGQAAGAASSAAPELTGDPAMVAIATQAEASLAAAKFVHTVARTRDADPLVISATFANGGGSIGTVGVGDDLVKFVNAGGAVYVQGSQPAFEALNVRLSPAQWAIIAGKWINVTADDGDLGPFGDLAVYLPTDFPTVFGAGGTLSATAGATIDGKQAVGILDVGPSTNDTFTVYISASPDRRPLRIQPTVTSTSGVDAEAITLDYAGYDVAAAIAAPPSAITTSDVLAPH